MQESDARSQVSKKDRNSGSLDRRGTRGRRRPGSWFALGPIPGDFGPGTAKILRKSPPPPHVPAKFGVELRRPVGAAREP